MSGGDWKAMFLAVQQGDLESVDYYLQIGIDPNFQHEEFLAAALVESIRYNHLKITKLLLENGADPHIKEIWGGATPLSVAKENKNSTAIDLLKQFMDTT